MIIIMWWDTVYIYTYIYMLCTYGIHRYTHTHTHTHTHKTCLIEGKQYTIMDSCFNVIEIKLSRLKQRGRHIDIWWNSNVKMLPALRKNGKEGLKEYRNPLCSLLPLFLFDFQYVWKNTKELMLLNCGDGEDSWESLGLQGDQTCPS